MSLWNNRQMQQPQPMRSMAQPPVPQGAQSLPMEEEMPQQAPNIGEDFERVLSSDEPLANKANQLNGFLRGQAGPQYREVLKQLVSGVGSQPANGDDQSLINAALKINPQEWFTLFAKAKASAVQPEMPQQQIPQPPMPPNIPQPPQMQQQMPQQMPIEPPQMPGQYRR